MSKSYSDFREMNENLFFHEGALFRTYFHHFCQFSLRVFEQEIPTKKSAHFEEVIGLPSNGEGQRSQTR